METSFESLDMFENFMNLFDIQLLITKQAKITE